MEEFVPIKGYEGLYEVSKNGIIKNLSTGKIIGNTSGNSYSSVSLNKNGVIITRGVHRIVAEAFVPNLENKPCVNHIDGNKSNNKYTNLEWVTHRENIIHATTVLKENRMNTSLFNPKYSFNKGFNNIKFGDVREFRKEMMRSLNIRSRVSWLKRLKGEIEPKITDAIMIEKIFKKYGIKKEDVWGNE